jgi:tetratricopeptide (TPR) repeat protein
MPRKLLFFLVILAFTGRNFACADDTATGHYFEPLPTDSIDALLEKGHRAVKTREDDAGLRAYQAVLKRGKPIDCAKAYIGMGNVYYGKQMYPQAMTSFDKAVAITKKLPMPVANRPDPYRGRAKVYLAMGNYKAALAEMNTSMAMAPTDGRIMERAAILQKLNLYDQAIADYTLGTKFTPQDPHMYYERARCYDKLGKAAEAARDRAMGNKLSNDMF